MRVALAGPNGKRTIHDGSHGELIDEPTIYSDNRDHPTIPTRQKGFPERDWAIGFHHGGLLDPIVGVSNPVAVRFHTHGIAAFVRAPSAGQFQQGVLDVELLVV